MRKLKKVAQQLREQEKKKKKTSTHTRTETRAECGYGRQTRGILFHPHYSTLRAVPPPVALFPNPSVRCAGYFGSGVSQNKSILPVWEAFELQFWREKEIVWTTSLQTAQRRSSDSRRRAHASVIQSSGRQLPNMCATCVCLLRAILLFVFSSLSLSLRFIGPPVRPEHVDSRPITPAAAANGNV